jgi:hypothetical protein
MDAKAVNDQIAALVDDWCERRELGALCGLLPAWLANNGLTDGWAGLADALHSLAGSRQLPDAERETLKRLWAEVDYALRNR